MRGFELKPGKVTPESIGAVPLHTLDGDKTIYVAKSGSDETGDGSGAKPFASIQKAVDTVVPGVWVGNPDVSSLAWVRIKVDAGIYEEDVQIRSYNGVKTPLDLYCYNNNVEIRSLGIYNSDQVVIRGGLTVRQPDNTKTAIYIFSSTAQLGRVNVIKPESENIFQTPFFSLFVSESTVTFSEGNLQGGGVGVFIDKGLAVLYQANISGSATGICSQGGFAFKDGVTNTAITKEYKSLGGQIFE